MVRCYVCKQFAEVNNEDIEQVGHDAETVQWKHKNCKEATNDNRS